MDTEVAIGGLAALAQETRLNVFRLLVRHEPDGVSAGDLAREIGVPHNTMSAHLSVLTRAGLVTGQRHSRSIVYRVELGRVRGLVRFLLEDCCGGNPQLCEPLLSHVLPCCPPADENARA